MSGSRQLRSVGSSPKNSAQSPKKTVQADLLSIVDSYIRYYASGSGHTARAKRLDLNHFLDFLAGSKAYSKVEKLKLNDWTFSATQRFVEESLDRGEAPATVARRLATLKHLGRTLGDRLPDFVNPAKEVKAPRVPVGIPKSLSNRETRAARDTAKKRLTKKGSFNRLRNSTLFELLLDTGLRADEVRLLKMSQVDENLEWIKNVRTKGKRYRNVYITSTMRTNLSNYLKAREERLNLIFKKVPKSVDRTLPLFISTYDAVPDKPESFLMGAKSIWRAVHELGGENNLHPHLLRHSFAMDLLESSHDVRLVSQALGHSDVRITMRYTERSDSEIARALEKSRKKSA